MSGMRENGLWAGVLHRFFDDALHQKPGRSPAAFVCIGDQESARSWLLSNSSGFREVCDLAGMDPDGIHDAAKALDAQGWPPPEEIKRTRRATA